MKGTEQKGATAVKQTTERPSSFKERVFADMDEMWSIGRDLLVVSGIVFWLQIFYWVFTRN